MAEKEKRYKVVFTHLRAANGNDHFNGEVLTESEIGNAELHLSRGAIEEVIEESAPETPVEEAPKPESKPKTKK
jgi:hypothetical protein